MYPVDLTNLVLGFVYVFFSGSDIFTCCPLIIFLI